MNEQTAPTSVQQVKATLGSVRFWAVMAVLTVVLFALATVAYNSRINIGADTEPAPQFAASAVHTG